MGDIFTGLDSMGCIAQAIAGSALFNSAERTLTLIFSDIANEEMISKFATDPEITCTLMNPGGVPKISKPLEEIPKEISGNKIILYLDVFTCVSDTRSGKVNKWTGVVLGDKLTFSTPRGCIRFLNIMEDIFTGKKISFKTQK